MLIPLRSFTGEFPRRLPHQLPDTAAQLAQDVDFTRGDLSGIKQRALVAGISVAGIRSLYVHDALVASWYAWNRDVDAVRGPIIDDQYARFYWCDGSNFYVSRGDIGSGAEPSASNRYKVGVPVPTAPLTLESAASFQLPDVVSTTYTLACEQSDGTFDNESVLGAPGSAAGNTYHRWSGSWSAAAPCQASGSESGSGAVALSVSRVADIALLQQSSIPTLSTVVYAASGGWPLYIHNPGWPDALWPDEVFEVTGSGEGVQFSWFVHVGEGWYSNVAGATSPGSAAASGAVALGPVLKLVFTRADGTQLSAVVRESSNATEWPSELEGYSANITLSGGTLALTMWTRTDLTEARAYTFTQLNQYGEESGPADPLVVENVVDGQPLSLRYPVPVATGYCPITKIRLQRTATGSGGTNYLFVREYTLDAANPVIVDDVKTEALGESLQTLGFLPPAQTLRGLVVLPNGCLAAFTDNEVHFSEPYLPYAWRAENIQTFPNRVMGIVAAEKSLYVTTTANPYIVSGVTPDAMSQDKLPALQAGVSKGSICSLGGQVAWASHDGIVLASGLNASTDASQQFFTREKWRADYASKLANMRFAAHDGHLLVYFDDGTPGFLLLLDEAAGTMTRYSEAVYGASVHPTADALYLASGSAVYEFKGGSAYLPWSWHSKDFIVPSPVNMACLQLVGTGSVGVQVYADGVLKLSTTAAMDGADRTVLRLPSGFLARRWSLKFTAVGSARLTEAYLATSMDELKHV